jgi:hypothetical protein
MAEAFLTAQDLQKSFNGNKAVSGGGLFYHW